MIKDIGAPTKITMFEVIQNSTLNYIKMKQERNAQKVCALLALFFVTISAKQARVNGALSQISFRNHTHYRVNGHY